MRFSAKTFAAMLMGLALAAFQFELNAQSRGNSRSSSSSRQSISTSTRKSGTSSVKSDDKKASKPSGRADMSPADRNPSKPSASKPSGNKPSVKPGSQPSKPVSKPSNKPAVKPNNPATVHKPAPKPPRVHPNKHNYGYRVKTLPPRVVRKVYRGNTYYHFNNVWYRPYNDYYVVCRPPFGTLLAADLIADMVWTIAKISYYDNLNQPKAKVARNLAYNLGLAQTYADQSSTYYYQDGVFYSIAPDGHYYVIVPPAGALVEELPDDFETVYMDGQEYFRVDDTLYQLTISEGKPYFEVLGQIN